MENKKQKPKVGDILYASTRGCANERQTREYPVKVVKVGNKYFTTGPVNEEGWHSAEWHIDNWRMKTDYSPDLKLYETKEQYEVIKETEQLHSFIRETFGVYSTNDFLLSQLRGIRDIIQNKPAA